MLFSRWGAFVYRFRKPIAVLADRPRRRLARARRQGVRARCRPAAGSTRRPNRRPSASASPTSSAPAGLDRRPLPRRSPAPTPGPQRSRRTIAGILDRLAADSRVNGVIGYAQTHDDRFISTDGTSAYVVVDLAITDEEAVDVMPELRGADRPAGRSSTLQLTGVAPVTEDQAHQSEKELRPGRDRLVPVRRADPDPRLRLARRGRHAAARRRRSRSRRRSPASSSSPR